MVAVGADPALCDDPLPREGWHPPMPVIAPAVLPLQTSVYGSENFIVFTYGAQQGLHIRC